MNIPPPIVELVPVANLKEWDKNPRKNHAVTAIAKSIESFGYLAPIIVQKGTYRVLAGHGRLKALRKKRIGTCPVIVADISDAQADAFTVADNKLGDLSDFAVAGLGDLFKTMDKEMLALTGFSDGEIDLAVKPPEPEEAPKSNNANTTLFLTFSTREQYKKVKAEIRRLQQNTELSMGDVIYSKMFPEA